MSSDPGPSVHKEVPTKRGAGTDHDDTAAGAPKKISRIVSSNAVRTRTAWCPVVFSNKDGYEIHIMWKSVRNSLELYSYKIRGKVGKGRKENDKKFLGIVKDFRVETLKNEKGEVCDYYIVTDEFEEVERFKASLMNPGMTGSNDFAKRMIGLRSGLNDRYLAAFLSRLPKCKGFSHSDENLFSDVGLRIVDDVSGDEQQEDTFELFLNSAKENAAVVTASIESAIDDIAVRTKRKKKSEIEKSIEKLSRHERIEKYFNKEVKDTAGVESEVVRSSKSRADVPLSHLSITEKVVLPIDEEKVKLIAREMCERFDPTNVYLTVVPSTSEGTVFDPEHLDENHYDVVHGRHRYLALQQLDRENKLALLPTFEARTVTCYILGVTELTTLNYLNLRGNEIASKFVSKPTHHDLLFTLHGLKGINHDNDGVMKAITRYANLQKSSDVEKAALRNLSKWPIHVLSLLKQLLLKYEHSQTADFDDSKMKSVGKKLKAGSKLITPIVLFKGIASLPFAYFEEKAQEMISGKLSIRDLVKNYSEGQGQKGKEVKVAKERRHKEAKIVELVGFESMEKVRSRFPEQFAESVLDKFPAEVCATTSPSPSLLEKYTLNVFQGKSDQSNSNELKAIELSEDLVELKLLLTKVKRFNNKAMLKRDISEVEFKINMLNEGEAEKRKDDPYCFKAEGENV